MSDALTDGLRRDRAMERRIAKDLAANKRDVLKEGSHKPIMGGLKTDPIPAKVRKLEERVIALETFAFKMLQYMDSQNAK